MIAIDQGIVHYLNQFSQRWPGFDEVVVMLSNSDLAKGGIVVGAVWGAWFCINGANANRNRSSVLSAVFGALVALFVARVLAAVLPLRTRPVLDASLNFRPPSGLPDQSNWTTWSSFPSDHAALFLSLGLGVFYVSKKWGSILFAYIFVFICLPRIYVGIHYPTDILGGAALGLGAVMFLAIPGINAIWAPPVLTFAERRPALFYMLFFVLSFQMATLFWDIRIVLNYYGFSS